MTATDDPILTASPAALFVEYERLALSVAARYRSRVGVDEYDDVRQTARLALFAAARSFDRSYGRAFAGYVRQVVEKAIWAYLRRRRLRGFALKATGPVPDGPGVVSLDAPLGAADDAGTVQDLVAAPAAPDPRSWPTATWRTVLDVLDPTPRRVVLWFYLGGQTADEIGKRLGVSAARVERVRQAAVETLFDRVDFEDLL